MKIIFFANTDWYLYNFRLAFAEFLRDRGWTVLFVSPPGPYGERLRAAGFRWEPLPMARRSLNPLRELALLARLRRLYARERPDLVQHFTIKCVVYGSLAARAAGIGCRVNAVTGLGHVFTADGWRARWLRPLVRGLLRLALGGAGSRLIVQNPDDAAAFERGRLVDPGRMRLIRGSGVDPRRFRPAAAGAAAAGRAVRVLLATRLLWEKGVGEYVAAARWLRAEGAPVECLLAGEPDPGNPASIPPDCLADWRAEGTVRLLGQVEAMPALLAEVDLAVLPSYREGVPRSLLEAAAAGLPLIATDVPGCREIVRDGVNGLLVPPRDARALAAAIRHLAADAEARGRMGRASRALAVAEFDQALVFERTLGVYLEVLPGGGGVAS